MIHGQRVLLTGATGYVGGRLVPVLLEGEEEGLLHELIGATGPGGHGRPSLPARGRIDLCALDFYTEGHCKGPLPEIAWGEQPGRHDAGRFGGTLDSLRMRAQYHRVPALDGCQNLKNSRGGGIGGGSDRADDPVGSELGDHHPGIAGLVIPRKGAEVTFLEPVLGIPQIGQRPRRQRQLWRRRRQRRPPRPPGRGGPWAG